MVRDTRHRLQPKLHLGRRGGSQGGVTRGGGPVPTFVTARLMLCRTALPLPACPSGPARSWADGLRL